ncbi:MAG: 2-phosphosulfolactate phosphatase [Candidatus Chisholmbacteria bacterium]|nr:2-phosphosulfolactate phosphatase [Candidatus Chisholmbacteria bacterium]
MIIRSYWLQKLPKRLGKGIYVVIDVWGATTNLAIMLSQKPKKLLITNKEQLPRLLRQYPKAIIVGESLRGNIKFTVSNLPNEVEAANFKDKIIAFSTTSGTKAFEQLKRHHSIIGCAFNNISAVAKFLRRQNQPVIIITAGDPNFRAQEDEFGREVLIKEIRHEKYNWKNLQPKIKQLIIDQETTHYSHLPGHQITPHLKSGIDTLLKRNQYSIIPTLQLDNNGFLEIVPLKH